MGTKIFCDIADLNQIKKFNKIKIVKGFTTNPSLMRKAGAKDYENYSKKILNQCSKKPISFEVFADDNKSMIRQGVKISKWGKNVYVKVISPNFDMRYIHSDKEIKETIQKIVRYSEPDPNKETIFIWPEGIFAGIYFEDLKKYSSTFSKSFSKKHLLIFGINTEDPSSNFFYKIRLCF